MAVTLSDIMASSQAERLATGFVFTEGPVWQVVYRTTADN
jgi:hypothetical protein